MNTRSFVAISIEFSPIGADSGASWIVLELAGSCFTALIDSVVNLDELRQARGPSRGWNVLFSQGTALWKDQILAPRQGN